jgi:chemotaxis protein MotB
LTRRLLVASGVTDARLDRVTGKADRAPVIEDKPRDPRNRRVEITLLRKF